MFFFFFFSSRRRHTRCLSDWSSDVCSSDLISNQLRTAGRVSRGRIGVVIQEVTKELAESFGLPKAAGALVNSVEKGSSADKAGLEPSDVILKFDSKTVNSSADLPRMVAQTRPGSKVTMQIW